MPKRRRKSQNIDHVHTHDASSVSDSVFSLPEPHHEYPWTYDGVQKDNETSMP
jgi:hypothetical protein